MNSPFHAPRRFVLTLAIAIAGFGAARVGLFANPSVDRPFLRLPAGLTPKASLGKSLFFDTSLSTPVGQSCGSCHSPSAGFTFPDSAINLALGVAPGVIGGRFGFRAVPQVSYAAFNPPGPPFYDHPIAVYVGGQFWDGHANDLADQAMFPFVNPNEMNNLTHNLADPALVVQKVAAGPSAESFKSVYGADVFTRPQAAVFAAVADAIAEYEKSSEVSPFSSKYDAWRAGKAELSAAELHGLRLATGTWTGRPDGASFPRFAQCVTCHTIPSVPSSAPDLWTNTCYQNIGVPRNPANPFYTQTDGTANPVGFNPQGESFVDIGLGATLYPRIGLPPGNTGPGSNGMGDFFGINGLFKAPSLRNVDMRPAAGFVKAYMHNGVFKSVKDVVHFYNTRNLTTLTGEVIDFTRDNPYQGLLGTPLWGTPEYASIDTLHNPEGLLPTDPAATGTGGESSAQVGNLGLTDEEEDHLVAFLATLTDGYFDPNIDADLCNPITSQPVSQVICLGGSARFTVASRDPDPVAYQWRHGSPPQPIDGANTSYYIVVVASAADVGPYDCVITSACGEITSRAAGLAVCAADFNCSGDVSVQDLFEFLQAWFAGEMAADSDGSGAVGMADIFGFLRSWFTKCA